MTKENLTQELKADATSQNNQGYTLHHLGEKKTHDYFNKHRKSL